MNFPRPLVLLFGAGATRGGLADGGIAPPLDADFFDIAGQVSGRGTPRLLQRVSRDVFEINRRVSGVGLEAYYRDIETRLELSRFTSSQNRPKDWRARTDALTELVRRVLIHTTCDLSRSPAKARASEHHRKILAELSPGDSIITFNYDTVIEESMPLTASRWTPRDGYGIPVGGLTHRWTKGWFSEHGLPGVRPARSSY